MGDFTYRTKEDVEAWKARDPIARFRDRLLAEAAAEAGGLDEIDTDVKALVAAAQRFAEESPWPDPATASRHVFFDS
jgi:TPP-dependent pyruvate/acetoin dehydrogenase alpha subunit